MSYKDQKVVPLFLSDINISKVCCNLQGRTKYIVLKVRALQGLKGFFGVVWRADTCPLTPRRFP